MNTRALWDHAMDHLKATADHPDALLNQWRSETPLTCTDRDLLGEYGWVVISCGLTPHVATKHWPRFTEAFLNWQPLEVAGNRIAVRTAALNVMKNPRKIDHVLDFADDLAREPGLMQRLAALELKQVLAKFATLPFVGANNRYHLARNLGWDVVVRTGPVPRLAAYLETTPEALCERIAGETGERVRTVDLVLWYWGHQVGDTAMKEMASLFKLL
ncbi:MAG TPA: hypothetical protein VD969_10535 [Symbiobacteriaceae bacterium]|nr:hypothetical protein [Symbiobacteriaceae bacterium]